MYGMQQLTTTPGREPAEEPKTLPDADDPDLEPAKADAADPDPDLAEPDPDGRFPLAEPDPDGRDPLAELEDFEELLDEDFDELEDEDFDELLLELLELLLELLELLLELLLEELADWLDFDWDDEDAEDLDAEEPLEDPVIGQQGFSAA